VGEVRVVGESDWFGHRRLPPRTGVEPDRRRRSSRCRFGDTPLMGRTARFAAWDGRYRPRPAAGCVRQQERLRCASGAQRAGGGAGCTASLRGWTS
jgi:hypothetical protein